MCVFTHTFNVNKQKLSPAPAPLPGSPAARTAGALLQHRRKLRRPGPGSSLCRLGPLPPPGWAARVSQMVGGRKTRRRDTRRRFTKRNGERWSSPASPLSVARLRGDPRAGGAGTRAGARGGFPAAAAPSDAAPPLPRPAAPSLPPASCRGGGIPWRRRREARSTGPAPPPCAASSRRQSARLPLRRDRSWMCPASHPDLEKDPHSVPSLLAERQKSPRLDRSNMVH